MSTTRLILVRHGETEWNRQDRYMGQKDSALTSSGIDGAERLRVRLADLSLDVCYSSDLERASRTAAILMGPRSDEIRQDSRLRERAMGIFEGLTMAERHTVYPDECADYSRLKERYVIPGGESAATCLDRCTRCLEELATSHRGKAVLVVTHGGVLLGFFAHVLGLCPFSAETKFLRPNLAWNSFTHDERGWVLETWGDVSHLKEVLANPVT